MPQDNTYRGQLTVRLDEELINTMRPNRCVESIKSREPRSSGRSLEKISHIHNKTMPHGTPVTCHPCDYGWPYTGDLWWTTHPRCGNRVEVEEVDDEREKTSESNPDPVDVTDPFDTERIADAMEWTVMGLETIADKNSE